MYCRFCCFFFQAKDGIRYLVRSRGLGDVYKRQPLARPAASSKEIMDHNQQTDAFDSLSSLNRKIRVLLVATRLTIGGDMNAVSYTHLRAHETVLDLVCRLLLEKKKTSHPIAIIDGNSYHRRRDIMRSHDGSQTSTESTIINSNIA